MPRDPVHPLTLHDLGWQVSPTEFTTPEGVILPLDVVQTFVRRWNSPVEVPDDLLPPSTQAGAMHGRALTLSSGRVEVPRDQAQGAICEDCGHFRYEAGQDWLRRHGNPFADDPRWGSRAPRSEDLGLCADPNFGDGESLTSRFWGSVPERNPDGSVCRDEAGAPVCAWRCPSYVPAGERLTSLDTRRGRRFNPIQGEVAAASRSHLLVVGGE